MEIVHDGELDLQIRPSGEVTTSPNGGDSSTVKAFYKIYKGITRDGSRNITYGGIVLKFEGLDRTSSNFEEVLAELTDQFMNYLIGEE